MPSFTQAATVPPHMNSASSGWAKITSALANPTRDSVPAAIADARRLRVRWAAGFDSGRGPAARTRPPDPRARTPFPERGAAPAGRGLLGHRGRLQPGDPAARGGVRARDPRRDQPGLAAGPERPRAARRCRLGARGVRDAQRLARPQVLLGPAEARRPRADGVRPAPGGAPARVRRAAHERARHRARQPTAARRDLARRRVRGVLDPAVDRRAVRPAARARR